MSYMIGVDVGGTFTDFSIFNTETGNLKHFKHSSTPDDPSRAIVSGILHVLTEDCIKPEQVSYLAHGTTVATNALIEKKGARLGLITTKGFRDLMEIGWQKRPSLYDLSKQKPESLIPDGMKREVEERILYDGTVKTALNEDSVREAVRYLKEQGAQTIAVCTLFSFINPKHEIRIREIINEEYPEAYVSTSHELVPEFREYSRMSTTVLNAYLGPVMEKYVHNFEKSILDSGITAAPYVTQSNGSVISIAETIDCPIKTAVSGPSAGVIGAVYIGKQCGIDKVITFDMGGTSIDVSLIENGKASLSNERLVEGYPARIPMIDIVTVGAGGGSIARIDAGGALKVGPDSAGATPGPACYMRGGTEACVTDANIVLGKLNQTKILGGRMDVDLGLAEKAIKENICDKSSLDLKQAAAGIISVVNSNVMLAEEENLPKVQKIFDTLTAEGNELLDKEGVAEKDRSFTYLIECRYERQNYEIGIEVKGQFGKEVMEEMIERFHQEHNRSYGYFNRSMKLQMVNYRVSAIGDIIKPDLAEMPADPNAEPPKPFTTREVLFDREKDYITTNIYNRNDFKPGCTIMGPAIIEQMDSTSVIPPDWKAYTDGYQNIIVTYEGGAK